MGGDNLRIGLIYFGNRHKHVYHAVEFSERNYPIGEETLCGKQLCRGQMRLWRFDDPGPTAELPPPNPTCKKCIKKLVKQ